MTEGCLELCVRIDPISSGLSKDDHIVITGDFDNWNPGQYVLGFDPRTEYFMVHLPYDGKSERFACKFVINDCEWKTLDCFDRCIDDQGHENNLIHCRAWLESEEIVGDIVMEDVELDIKPVSSSICQSDLGIENLHLDSQTTDHDYIHVTSRGELSSSEDVELDPRTAHGEIDDLLDDVTVSGVQPPENSSKSVTGFLAAFRRAKTYWSR